VIGQWRQHYNTVRPHAALGYMPPAPGAYRVCVTTSLLQCGKRFLMFLGMKSSSPIRSGFCELEAGSALPD
jgi:integrase-like protein